MHLHKMAAHKQNGQLRGALRFFDFRRFIPSKRKKGEREGKERGKMVQREFVVDG